MDKRIQAAIDKSWENELIKPSDTIIVVTGWRSGSGYTNTVRIIQVPPRAAEVHLIAASKATDVSISVTGTE